MNESLPTVVIPAPDYFCNLAIFPAPSTIHDAPKFFLLKNMADVPSPQIGSVVAKYVEGSIYCLFPSFEKSNGTMTVYKNKPKFLDSYTHCLEINEHSVDFLNCKPCKTPASGYNAKCSGCFISHFPSPNTTQCKWKKKNCLRDSRRKISLPRLRGGADADPERLIIKRAVENARAHGINVHAGVQNLGNGNCLFESVIDSINTRSIFQEIIEETPDNCRRIWMEEVEDIAYDEWNLGLSRAEWAEEW